MLVLITRDIFDSILSGVNNRADICLSVPAFQGEGKCVKEEEQEKACLIFEVQLVLADNTVASTDQNKHTPQLQLTDSARHKAGSIHYCSSKTEPCALRLNYTSEKSVNLTEH